MYSFIMSNKYFSTCISMYFYIFLNIYIYKNIFIHISIYILLLHIFSLIDLMFPLYATMVIYIYTFFIYCSLYTTRPSSHHHNAFKAIGALGHTHELSVTCCTYLRIEIVLKLIKNNCAKGYLF